MTNKGQLKVLEGQEGLGIRLSSCDASPGEGWRWGRWRFGSCPVNSVPTPVYSAVIRGDREPQWRSGRQICDRILIIQRQIIFRTAAAARQNVQSLHQATRGDDFVLFEKQFVSFSPTENVHLLCVQIPLVQCQIDSPPTS